MSDVRKRTCWPQVIAALGIAAVGGIAIWQYQTRTDAFRRLGDIESQNRELRARAGKTARELERLRQAVPQAAPERLPEAEQRTARPENVETARLLIQLREKLASAGESIQQLDTRTRELEATIEKLTADNKRLSADGSDLKETLATTTRILDAVRTELKGKDERLTQVMVTNNQLLEENRKNGDKLSQMPRLLRDLDEINRRREAYVNNILRRYREVTDQYRAIAGRADQAGDAGAGSPELTRIQNALQMAEEDLRQLSSLNAQAGRLQQRIGGR